MLSGDQLAEDATAVDTIFVLDADHGSRRFLAALLSRAGFRTAQFACGREVLSALRSLRPSLIVTDLASLEMSGVDFLAALRRQDGWRRIPAVVLSDENAPAFPVRVDAPVVYKSDLDGLLARVRSMVRR